MSIYNYCTIHVTFRMSEHLWSSNSWHMEYRVSQIKTEMKNIEFNLNGVILLLFWVNILILRHRKLLVGIIVCVIPKITPLLAAKFDSSIRNFCILLNSLNNIIVFLDVETLNFEGTGAWLGKFRAIHVHLIII